MHEHSSEEAVRSSFETSGSKRGPESAAKNRAAARWNYERHQQAAGLTPRPYQPRTKTATRPSARDAGAVPESLIHSSFILDTSAAPNRQQGFDVGGDTLAPAHPANAQGSFPDAAWFHNILETPIDADLFKDLPLK